MFSDNQKIGTTLLGLGVLFLGMGVMFFFDKFLLSLGNLMFLAGLLFTMGISRSMRFFRKKTRDCGIRGVGCFFSGIFLVLIFRRPVFGMILESFGFLNLFANFFPIALQAMRQMPVIGPILDTPGISSIADKIAGVDQRRSRTWVRASLLYVFELLTLQA